MDKYTHLVNKSIIPVLLVFLGIYLLIAGFGDIEHYDEAQNSYKESGFLYGAIASLLMGVFIFIINFEVINSKIIKKITLPLSLIILLPFAGHLSYRIFDSIDSTIQEMDNKKLYDSYIQQGLNDIKDIQTEYKKVYGWYSNDYKELKRFLLEDSLKMVSLIVPDSINGLKNPLSKNETYAFMDKKITPEHQAILGYDSTNNEDWKEIANGYNDEEALTCNLLVKDTVAFGILNKLFPEKQAEKNRVFPFDIDNFQYVPSLDFHPSNKSEFILKTDINPNTGSSSKYFFLYYNKCVNKFTSNHLINPDKKFNHLYGKEGLILIQDSLLGNKKITKGDVLVSINNMKPEKPTDIREILSSASLKDTINLELKRYKVVEEKDSKTKKVVVANTFNLEVVLSTLSISRTQDMNYWINDLETSFASSFYDPKDYIVIPVEAKFLKNTEDGSSNHPLKNGMYLDTTSIKKISEHRSFYKGIEFEYEKGKYYTLNDATDEPVFIYLKTKIGAPVFVAQDPNPYDPLSICPKAWRIGSLKEIKTNGNWD